VVVAKTNGLVAAFSRNPDCILKEVIPGELLEISTNTVVPLAELSRNRMDFELMRKSLRPEYILP
jgi:hypothetical protein